MRTLRKTQAGTGFIEREKDSEGEYIPNKCGRDFLYYALNHYFPGRFNPSDLNPERIDSHGLFGIPTSPNLAWTQVQFSKAPKYLKEQGLQLQINDQKIDGYLDFVNAILFSRKQLEVALNDVAHSVDANIACGIDISLGMQGLLDHVVFVYGYDAENLYVVDTHNVPQLGYEQVDDRYPFLFKLSKKVVTEKWTAFGRVWKVLNS
jgi:hypothetical protein